VPSFKEEKAGESNVSTLPAAWCQTRVRAARGSDGTRVLVDRIWPRGLTKEHASVDVWLKDIAPSGGLRTWFGHDPNRWREFHKRYFEELSANHAAVEHLTDLVSTGIVTLLFGAHDTERNNAVALADYLAAR
jgi:uncharacterized protein YeaO (DUF488 family)